MSDLKQSLIDQIQLNCDVSDSRYWGFFSICGLLMSLRVLYLTINDMKPWSQIDRSEISNWISNKEQRWEELEGEDFKPLTINGMSLDPFDAESINDILKEENLVYGAGYGLFKKPSFFLADLDSYREVNDCKVYSSKREYVRDLFASPGMLRDRQIFIRLDPLMALLWDKFLESKGKCNSALAYAFAQYDLAGEQETGLFFKNRFEGLTRKYADVILYHEMGEVAEEVDDWQEMVLQANTKDDEFFLRAIEDLIADTSDFGPIRRCIEEKDKGNLSLCVALLDRYKVKMHLEIREAFDKFVDSEDWNLLEEARKRVYAKLISLREELTASYRKSRSVDDLFERVRELKSRLS